MQQSLSQAVLSILTIAQYPKNKDKFVAEFEALNILQAMLRVYKQLPEDKQLFIKEHADDTEALVNSIPLDMYQEALMQVRFEELHNLLKSIMPTLTLRQKEKINQVVVTL